jgi:hypothetical protein
MLNQNKHSEWTAAARLTIKTLVEIDIMYAGIHVSTDSEHRQEKQLSNILERRAILPLSDGQNFSFAQLSILSKSVSIRARQFILSNDPGHHVMWSPESATTGSKPTFCTMAFTPILRQ